MIPINYFKIGDIVRFNTHMRLKISDEYDGLQGGVPHKLKHAHMTITEINRSTLSFKIKEHPEGTYSGHYWELVSRPSESHFEKDLFEL